MVYECDKCENPLGPGMLFCPYCGEKFPNPVPGDPASTPGDTATSVPISQPASKFPSPSFQAQVPPIPVRKKTSFVMKVLATVGALLVIFWIIGAISGSSKPANPIVTTNASTPSPAITPQPVPLTPEQKHAAAVKAHEQNLQQERQAREQKRAERREAERQARQQAEQEAEEAKTEREAQEARSADDEAHATIKAKVQHDYPNDYITQKGVYDMAVQAYEFMKTVPNDEMKAKVENDYPNDYITQKGVYEMAAQAKHDMQ